MSTKPNDFDVAKQIAEALEPFESADKEKIIRWVCESLGIEQKISKPIPFSRTVGSDLSAAQGFEPGQPKATDIKSFLTEKAPKSDNQFAAAVAYYYMFEVPPDQRKNAINKDDLVDATRKGGTRRLTRPDQTLVNAHNTGLLDKGSEKGTYTINSVGENLVAMIMPSDSGKVNFNSKKGKKRSSTPKKKAAKKK